MLGCSLSAQRGYANYLELQGNEVINLARSAGSNDLQQFLLGECFMQGKIDRESTIIWQITGLQRKSLVLEKFDPNFCNGSVSAGRHDWVPINLCMSGEYKVWLLSNNTLVPKYYADESVLLQNLAIDIYRWSLLVKKIIVVMGWKDIAVKESLQSFLDWLTSKQILVIPLEQSIVDWCRTTGQEFSDDEHPAESGYIHWCKHNLERLL